MLPTRLSAVDEAATIDVLCADKTGTLTLNQLSVQTVRPLSSFTEAYVLGLAALASSEGGEDSVDAAIRSASLKAAAPGIPKLVKFVPFDPSKKTAEAEAIDAKGQSLRIVKGAFTVVAGLAAPDAAISAIADDLERQGVRVLAVASGAASPMTLAGLIALSDPPRGDSSALISELTALGVRTIRITGDAPASAVSVR